MQKHLLLFVFLLFIFISGILGKRLRISGKDFYYGTDRVFLSGANIAWDSYGYDFGNYRYDHAKVVLEEYVRKISAAGGNSLRIWIHVEGQNSPKFDDTGFVVDTDNERTLISDLGRFLDYAQSQNVFVIPVLWNGAQMREDKMANLVWDDNKLKTYIDNALVPMVKALAGKPALAAWDIMNEPEGSITVGRKHRNVCYDTNRLSNSGAGWTGRTIPMERMTKFLASQVAAIHEADPGSLVTIGSFSEKPQSDAFSDTYNYYKDNCMTQAGGSKAAIDFFQMHTYAWGDSWAEHAPFKVSASDYQLNKPLVIGEFSADCAGDGESIEQLFDYGYNRGYNGLWTWQYNGGGPCSDNQEVQNRGIRRIRSNTNNGRIPVTVQ